MGTVTLATQVAPSTPSSGNIIIYGKSDGLLYWKDSSGTEYTINTGAVTTWQGLALANLGFSASVSSNALTIALKGLDGNDPSVTNAVYVPFRSSTAASGDVDILAITAASSVVVSSGSTLGTANSVAFRVWVVGFNDAGTFRLGVINCLTTSAGAGAGRAITAIYPLSGWGIASSTAEGGAGAADSALTFYTGTAVSSKQYIVLGYFTYESGLATAGTYASAPTRGQTYLSGTPLPGQPVQIVRNDTGAVATGTTLIPFDDTIPQNTEGDQYLSQAITPSSAANALTIDIEAQLASSAGSGSGMLALAIFQDATANALAVSSLTNLISGNSQLMHTSYSMLAGTTSSTTFKARAGNNTANTITLNGQAGGRLYGGVYNSYMQVVEIMG